MQTDLMQNLHGMRVPGDPIFFFGAVALVWFIFGPWTGHSFSKEDDGFGSSEPSPSE